MFQVHYFIVNVVYHRCHSRLFKTYLCQMTPLSTADGWPTYTRRVGRAMQRASRKREVRVVAFTKILTTCADGILKTAPRVVDGSGLFYVPYTTLYGRFENARMRCVEVFSERPQQPEFE